MLCAVFAFLFHNKTHHPDGWRVSLEQGTGIDLHLRVAQIMVRLGPAVAGDAHPRRICICSIPFPTIKETHRPVGWCVSLERVMGIEPTSQAWEARILPMNYTRIGRDAL